MSPFKPMLASPGSLPIGPEWFYEFKWDGMRLIVEGSPEGGLRMHSREGIDFTGAFPELDGMLSAFREAGIENFVLDGELVALHNGKESFPALTNRMKLRTSTPARIAEEAKLYPVNYIMFDAIHLNDMRLAGREYVERRTVLEQMVPMGDAWTISMRLTAEWAESMLATVKQLGMEGVVAKRAQSRYYPGIRSTDWVKVKIF